MYIPTRSNEKKEIIFEEGDWEKQEIINVWEGGRGRVIWWSSQKNSKDEENKSGDRKYVYGHVYAQIFIRYIGE